MEERKCIDDEEKFYNLLDSLFERSVVKMHEEYAKSLPEWRKAREEIVEKERVASGESSGVGSGKLRFWGHCNEKEYIFAQKVGNQDDYAIRVKTIIRFLTSQIGEEKELLIVSDLQKIGMKLPKERDICQSEKQYIAQNIAILKYFMNG